VRELSHLPFISDSGILQIDLSTFNGIFISTVWAKDSAYLEEEASIIREFVESGGGLLIMADKSPREALNAVTQIFGTSSGGDLSSPLFIINLADHPIFRGVEVVRFNGGVELISVSPSEAVAWDAIGRAAVVVAEIEDGRVVIVGDSNIFDDTPTPPFSSNETFIRNILLWILRLECFSFEDLNRTIAEAEINSHGIRNSLQSKAINARRQYDLGNVQSSGNILCALLHEVNAQEGIRNCVQSMAEALEINLHCLERKEKVALRIETFPNPFSISRGGEITITFSSLANKEYKEVKVYDISGRLVRTLVDGKHVLENISIGWDGQDEKGKEVRSGVYFLRLTSGNSNLSQKLIILK
jgi:hypothetical protein